ncbi:putative bifunctional diguanylate cyclase/phosphodiesterase [Zemynaea arenosa]|nr:EAL domain-containing protein [Massilia arenosa]
MRSPSPPLTPEGSPSDAHDDLVFLDEQATTSTPRTRATWKVMIIDDDQEVHTTTAFALANLETLGRTLEFIHACSAREARELLAREDDIAVVLLDVVMEQDDAGLTLVRYIRETLGRADVRIILRTGQPGYAPELDAVRDFDINDYKTKSELTRIKLFTTVTAAIRSYEQIRALDAGRQGLDRIIRAGTELMALHGMHDFGAGVLAQATGLLGLPPDGVLCGRHNGDALAPDLSVLASAGAHERPAGDLLRPRDAAIRSGMWDALNQRRNVICTDAVALYFGGKSARECVAWLPIPRPLTDIECRLLEVFSRQVAVGLDNVELVTNLHDAAFYDQLSRLPNRTRLLEVLHGALGTPTRAHAALALVDLDHFAETNDALGHEFGDMLLIAVASRLQTRLGAQLTIARMGADIFGVLGDASFVNPDRILQVFREPFRIEGQDMQVSATLGLVRLAEHDGSAADALKDADLALKRAKAHQRGGHFTFSRAMGAEMRERVRMMHALRAAFANKELTLAYQPQVNLATRQPMGAEALLRWQRPDGSFVPPDRFIPIAEYSGLIIEIGQWVIETACAELVRLRALGHRAFTMSVNVSQVQFRHPYFVDMLRGALARTQAPPEYLHLEITESVAMEEPDTLIRMLAQIKETGVSIAIDDFGTGFSSLSYLQRLQVDCLKIDRAFVSEITESARGSSIAEMVVQLGRNLGLSIVAEGVEDERQAQVLEALGCPYAQGYLFSRPITPQQLAEWLATHNAHAA